MELPFGFEEMKKLSTDYADYKDFIAAHAKDLENWYYLE